MGSDLLQEDPLAHPAVNRVMVGGPDLLTLANHCGTSTNVFPNANPSLGYASRRGMFPCHLFSPNFQQVRLFTKYLWAEKLVVSSTTEKVPSVYRSRDEDALAMEQSEDEGNLVDTSPLLLRSPSSLTLLSHNPGDTRWHPVTRKVVKVVRVDNIKGTVEVELEKGDRVTVARNTIVP